MVKTATPSYELWLSAARHGMSTLEKTCRNAARMQVAQHLAERGISYFVLDLGISPTIMDGVIMDLMKLKDNYIAHRQVSGGITIGLN